MNTQRLALIGGISALGMGLLANWAPVIMPYTPGRVTLAVIGLFTLIQAYRVARRDGLGAIDEANPPTPECPSPASVPGEELGDVLREFVGSSRIIYRQERFREGLRTAAHTVLTTFGGYADEEASAALSNGMWTEDPIAAAFIAGRVGSRTSPVEWVQRAFQRESTLSRRVRHTVDAIGSVVGMDWDSNRADRGVRGLWSRFRNLTTDRGSVVVGSESNRAPPEPSVGYEVDAGNPSGREVHPTEHWAGISFLALVGIGVGLLAQRPSLLLVGAVGIGYAAYARSAMFPPGEVSITRTIDTDRPDPGEPVRVRVTITNESDRPLADVRVIDGVPAAIGVSSGSPRLGTALRAGTSETFEYTVRARRGEHSFQPATVITRDLAGSQEQERRVRAEVQTTLLCSPTFQPLTSRVPLRPVATKTVGDEPTNTGGSGVEFFETRAYRPGDPLSRIDWNRWARTGELTTLDYREERAARVILLIDARNAAYVAPQAFEETAVERATLAAGRLYRTLANAGNRVGVATVSPDPGYLAPEFGTDQYVRVQEFLSASPPSLPPTTDDRRAIAVTIHRLRTQLSAGTQVIFLSPLTDAPSERLARWLEAAGYPTTVVSPDASTDRTAGQRFAGVARRLRVARLRRGGIPVIDWPWMDTLDLAVVRAGRQEFS